MSTAPTASPITLDRWEKSSNLAALAALASSGQVTIRPNELIRTSDSNRVYHWTGTALDIVSAPVHHGTVANPAALDGIYLLPSCTRGVHPGDTAFVTSAGCEYRVTSGINATAVWAACASIPTTASAIGADPAGTAATAVSTHNTATDSHTDIRTLVADRVPISTTRLGSVGNTPLTTTALSAADWAALPVGWRGIISAEAALASGLPAADVYHLQKVSNRDVSGGAAYQAQGYLSPTLYIGVAATSSNLPTWASVGGGGGGSIYEITPGWPTTTHTFSSFGDTNGLVYAAATSGQPVALSTSGSVGGGKLLDLLDRAADDIQIAGPVGTWVQLDFGDARAVSPDYFTIRNNSKNYDPLRNWEWRGSNDLATWTVLDFRIDDTTLSASSVWGGWAPNAGTGPYFRYVRLVLTGRTGAGGSYIRIGELELYGSLLVGIPLPSWATVWLTDGTHMWPGRPL